MSSSVDTTVIGVDGAGPGWVAAILDQRRLLYVSDLGDLPSAAVIAVDIPLGFPSGEERRPAEVAASECLAGGRSSSVFRTAPLAVYELELPNLPYEEQHARASQLMRELTGDGMSRQSFGLRDKILHAQQAMKAGLPLIEVHPEVIFASLAGHSMANPKATWQGHMERSALLADAGLDPHSFTGDAGKAGPDDVLDAIAAALVASKRKYREAKPLVEPVTDGDQPIWTWPPLGAHSGG